MVVGPYCYFPVLFVLLFIILRSLPDARRLLDAVSRHERSEPRYRRQAPRAMGPLKLGAACFPSWGPLKWGGARSQEQPLLNFGASIIIN